MRIKKTLEQRFWEKVDRTGACWIWTACKAPNGYGRFCAANSQHDYAHRVCYLLTHGAIPEGKEICHSCDNPSCVNPAHLFAWTHAQNMADRNAKGRTSKGERHPLFKPDKQPRQRRIPPELHKPRYGAVMSRPQKLTPEKVREIRLKHVKMGLGPRPLAREYGLNRKTVQRILKGELWKHVK